MPPGLHLGCGIARLSTHAQGVGGFFADGPSINALRCIEDVTFSSRLEPGESRSCGLWLAPAQILQASDAVRDLSDAMGPSNGLIATSRIPARIVARLCAPIDPWFQGAPRELALEARGLELIATALMWLRCEPERSEKACLPQVLKTRDLLEARLTDPPSLAEVSRTVALNERSLTAAFRATFGVSIAAYVTTRRLDIAAGLLEGGASPGEAARTVGYRTTHLAVAFKRRFGVSPGAYRRR